jgi:hypothetical protein
MTLPIRATIRDTFSLCLASQKGNNESMSTEGFGSVIFMERVSKKFPGVFSVQNPINMLHV